MAFSVQVVADSKSPTGDRLTTLIVTYPRSIHSEIMTHKMLSKSSASSRAIPTAKMLENIENDPFIPIWWGMNQGGMQAYQEIEDKEAAKKWWLDACADALKHTRRGVELNLHKQIPNRLIEPWMWITVIMSSTTWTNYIGLRDHPAAEPHFQKLAKMTKAALEGSTPKDLVAGDWHLPLIYEEDYGHASELLGFKQQSNFPTIHEFNRVWKSGEADDAIRQMLVKVSVGRCARVSYLTHDGRRDLAEDVSLHDKLVVQEPLHAAPAEHVAMAMDYPKWFKQEWPNTLSKKTASELNDLRWKARDDLAALDANKEIDMISEEYGYYNRMMALEAVLSQIQSGNFRGFKQYRKMKMNEHIGERMP